LKELKLPKKAHKEAEAADLTGTPSAVDLQAYWTKKYIFIKLKNIVRKCNFSIFQLFDRNFSDNVRTFFSLYNI
jgi:hypothetical protein